ncbi:transposase [Streptomyces sp. NPDC002545]
MESNSPSLSCDCLAHRFGTRGGNSSPAGRPVPQATRAPAGPPGRPAIRRPSCLIRNTARAPARLLRNGPICLRIFAVPAGARLRPPLAGNGAACRVARPAARPRAAEGRPDGGPDRRDRGLASLRAAANIPRSTSGWDGGKKVGGRKRHLVVDCLGLVLAVAVTAANVQDRDAAVPLLERLRRRYFPSVLSGRTADTPGAWSAGPATNSGSPWRSSNGLMT